MNSGPQSVSSQLLPFCISLTLTEETRLDEGIGLWPWWLVLILWVLLGFGVACVLFPLIMLCFLPLQ